MKDFLNKGLLILSILSVGVLLGCNNDEDEDTVGDWKDGTQMSGDPRRNAVSFVIGNTAYIGAGYKDNNDEYLSDFWAYNSDSRTWSELSPIPGLGRTAAVGFAIGEIAYVGTGYNDDDQVDSLLNDFYKYNVATDTWEEIASFPGAPRSEAIGFGLNGKGYVGTGNDGDATTNDFYEYDPGTDTWTQIQYPGRKVDGAAVFIIDNIAYIGTGQANLTTEDNFYSFNPANSDNPWTSLLDLDEDNDYLVERYNAVAFSYQGLGYVATGISAAGGTTSSVWEYNPDTDLWTEKTAFEGSLRSSGVAFVVGGEIYVGTGNFGDTDYDDFWTFEPSIAFDEDDD